MNVLSRPSSVFQQEIDLYKLRLTSLPSEVQTLDILLTIFQVQVKMSTLQYCTEDKTKKLQTARMQHTVPVRDMNNSDVECNRIKTFIAKLPISHLYTNRPSASCHRALPLEPAASAERPAAIDSQATQWAVFGALTHESERALTRINDVIPSLPTTDSDF